jgi:hypothetical protein
VPAGALLTAAQVTALLQGGLYVTAGTAANPNGELRGQIVPTNVTVIFSVLNGAQEVPSVASNAAGVAATTVDTVANTLTVHVHATGVDDALAAEVDDGAAGATGPQLAALTRDDIDPGHWSTQLVEVSAADHRGFQGEQLLRQRDDARRSARCDSRADRVHRPLSAATPGEPSRDPGWYAEGRADPNFFMRRAWAAADSDRPSA